MTAAHHSGPGRAARHALGVAAAALLAIAVALAVPAPAGAVTFGADLSRHSANVMPTCATVNFFNGRTGCSVWSIADSNNPSDFSQGHIVPLPDPRVHGNQSGTITEVRFKPAPGAPPGPARLSVIEWVRDADSTADPGLVQDIADTATFTMAPGADGLVKVKTDLPVRAIYNASDNSYRYDNLVVSMLDNSTPVPFDSTSSYLSAYVSPYVTAGDLTTPLPDGSFYTTGAWFPLGLVLMQAELTIHSAISNEFSLGKPKRNPRRGTAKLPVRVPGAGRVALRETRQLEGAVRQVSEIAAQASSAAASAESGHRVRLPVRPRGKAKRRIAKRRCATTGKRRLTVRVRAKVSYRPAGGKARTERIRLKLVRRC